jgi:hypothetical protein
MGQMSNVLDWRVLDHRPDILDRGMGFRATALAFLLGCLLRAQSDDRNSKGQQPNPAAEAPTAPPLVACPAGAPLGALDLRVAAGDQRLPFRTINRLSEGDSLLYAPILRGKEKPPGEIALVLVPEKRNPGDLDILVTDPKAADKPQEWSMTRAISLAAFVYGPGGLSRRKVAKFLLRDEALIAQLADYADKTAQAEQLVTTLSNNESSSASVNAALSGFASEYGFAVQIDRNAPVQSQAATVFAAMNPQLAAYNPLASSTAQTVGQTASLATMAGALFFGSPIGLAAGGTAMLLDLRSIAFPDTQFRASFAQALAGSTSGVNLCGQQGPLPAHTRVAYIWASRVPNVPAPSIHIGDANFIPPTLKTPLAINVPGPAWKYLDRARQWTLVGDQTKVPIPVIKLGNQQALELDLTKAKIPAGDYKLSGLWDWTPFQAAGTVHVVPLEDFEKAHLDPASQDRVLAKSGKVPVTLKGADFEFTTKVELQKANDEFAMPESVRFLLPKGLRKGPQDHMDIQLDTEDLNFGLYKLLITQQDGKSHPVDFKVLPNPPKIDNLPILANQGVVTQHFVLKGERLEQVSKLEAPGAVLSLSPPTSNQTERSLTVELKAAPRPGTALPVTAYLDNRSEPLNLPDALEITGPLPVIASSRLSLPKGLAIQAHPDEFPVGYTLNAMLDVKNIERQSVLRLACADGVGKPVALHIGEQTPTQTLQQLSPDQLFLAVETVDRPAGCLLQAVIDNGRDGSSQPFTLAHIVLVPQIDGFTVVDATYANKSRQYQLTGQNLEMIDKLGWDKNTGLTVPGLPAPLPGQGLKQSIQVALPEPPTPESSLYVWLRADKEGRGTTIKAPTSPAPPEVGQPAITVTSSPDPSFVQQDVTFIAKLNPPEATGTVDFRDGLTSLGMAELNAGQATFTTSSLVAGSHAITVVYSGDTNHAASTSPALTQTVAKQATGTNISSTPNPSTGGQPVTFTAVVAANPLARGTPGGIVTFYAGDTALGASPLDFRGMATFTTSALAGGNYNVRAIYSGSVAFAESSSTPITHLVQ